MKKNIPNGKADLVASGNAATNGAQSLETIIGLQHNKAADIRVDVHAFTSADTAASVAETELIRRHAVVRSLVLASQEKLRLARDNFRATLGRTYNERWNVLGFNGSLYISTQHSALPAFLFKFSVYLTAHPEEEVAVKQITAAQFTALYNELNGAFAAVLAQETAVRDARLLRKSTAADLRERLRDLHKELAIKLEADDSRWLQFGFAIPGASRRPAAPKRVTVALTSPTSLAVKWERSPHAKHYRLWKKVDGVDADFVSIGNTAGLDFTIEEILALATVEVAVSAVNDAGESARSPVIRVMLK